MAKGDDLDSKVVELQTQLAFQEDLLTALNARVAAQDEELQRFKLLLKSLREQIEQLRNESGPRGAAIDERPPHY